MMYEKLKGVVLNTVRYNDTTSIVHIYTDQRGLMAFAVTQGASRTARLRNAMLMPLSLVNIEARISPQRSLCRLREVQPSYPLVTLYSDPIKNAIAMFISELMTHVIQEVERNTALFRYLEQAVQLLEQLPTRDAANFHICYLYHLGAHLGIQPNVQTYQPGYWFDMTDGVFVSGVNNRHPHLRPEQAQVIYLLSRMTFANMTRFRFTRDERNSVLDVILNYYKLHNASIGTLRSPDILRQLFA